MFSILLIVDFFLCFSIAMQTGKSARQSFLIASIVWTTLLLIVTEFLSSFHYLTAVGIAEVWFAILIVLMLSRNSGVFSLGRFSIPANKIWHSLTKIEKIWLLVIALFVAIEILTALLSPPNSRDSLTYHMPRVMHWLQNQSVDLYPTTVIRQLVMPPLSEYIVLHFQALLGSDGMANLVQCFYLCGTAIVVSMLAQQFGAERKMQIFSALIAVTNPVALLQAASTLNDIGAAYWVMCALYFLILIIQRATFRLIDLIWFGLSISLAMATKASAYFAAFPLVVWLFLGMDRKYMYRALICVSVVLALIMLVNGPHWLNIFQMYNSPKSASNPYADASTIALCDLSAVSPGNILANIIRFLTDDMHFPFQAMNKPIWSVVRSIFHIFNINPQARGYLVPIFQFPGDFLSGFHEVYAGCPLQTVLSWLAIIYALWNFKQGRLQAQLACCLVCIYFLMCFFLRWGPYSCRYHLIFFFISIPLIISWLGRQRINLPIFGTVLILAAIPYAVINDLRPLLGQNSVIRQARIDQLFIDRLGDSFKQEQSYREACKLLEKWNCRNIGLISYWDGNEYPLWVLTKNIPKRHIDYINVENQSKMFAVKEMPDVVIELLGIPTDGPHLPNDFLKNWQPMYSSCTICVYRPGNQ